MKREKGYSKKQYIHAYCFTYIDVNILNRINILLISIFKMYKNTTIYYGQAGLIPCLAEWLNFGKSTISFATLSD